MSGGDFLHQFHPQGSGRQMYLEQMTKLRYSLLFGPASRWSENQQRAEWDLILKASVLKTQEEILYTRFLRALRNQEVSQEDWDSEERVLSNCCRPELKEVFFFPAPQLASDHLFFVA